MSNACPECGTSMEFEDHEVRMKTGVCPSCTKEFAIVQGSTVATRLGVSAEDLEDKSEGAAAGGLECAECGSPLQIREGSGDSLEVACPECETVAVFVPKEEETLRERPEARSERFEGSGPRGRPCRRCGAPLRFTTGDDGLLVGECDKCGNRFTLPPRRDGGGGGGRDSRPGPRYGRGSYGGRPRGGRYQDRSSEGPRSRGPPSRGRSDDDDRRRRRRPPRDE